MNENAYNSYVAAADASPAERGLFIRRTYTHLAGAVLVFAVLETALLVSPISGAVVNLMAGMKYSWLIVMAIFMGISWLAQSWAQSETSKPMQYAGLSLYVVAYVFLFMPILLVASRTAPNLIPMAGMLTLGLFLGLTAVVMITRKDFSFMRAIVSIGFFVALGTIVASIIFGFSLGIYFSGAMILLAAGAILYQTSAIFLNYRTDQYVAASVALFASVATLFFYILRLLMAFRR